jgi:predicted RNA-binding protein (virulence factor B family)
MTNKKITKRDRFNALLSIPAVQADAGLVDFINHELELLAKKNSADKKPTAQQTANEAIKSAIVEAMEANRLYTVTEIQKSVDECADLSNQRVSALLRQLKDDGVIVRIEDKRKAYFSLA